jgi:hypothetical protein
VPGKPAEVTSAATLAELSCVVGVVDSNRPRSALVHRWADAAAALDVPPVTPQAATVKPSTAVEALRCGDPKREIV